jgi:hypothetical protein
MAFFPAPGVGQVRVTGTIGPNPFAVVLHWFQGAPSAWSQSQIQALATSVRSHWDTNLIPHFATNVHTLQADSVDLTDTTERAGITPPTSVAGGQAGNAPTLAACFLVSHKIGARFRGGHPRTYLPPGSSTNTTDGDTWQTSVVAVVQTAWDTFKAGVNSDLQAAGLATANQCCPRYSYSYTADPIKHKFVKARTGFIGAFPVTAPSVVQTQIATQRRRLGV